MASRSGQSGYIERKGNAYYVRFRIDVSGQERRAYKSIRLCPVSGPGFLGKAERRRKAKEMIQESGADTAEHFEKIEAINRGESFRSQAAIWMKQVANRKRKPVKPATLHGWKWALDKYVLPEMGDMHLADIGNLALKRLGEKLSAANLSANTIRLVCALPKMVLASVIDDEGDGKYPRKWNAEFLDLPTITDQHQPVLTSEQVTQVVSKAEGQFRVLFALLAATGVRAGEVFGLEVQHVSADGKTIHIRQSLWGKQILGPKTKNSVRDIDVHPSVAAMLRGLIGERKSGFVFQTREQPFLQTNVLRRSLHPVLKEIGIEKMGFHSFRRYRVTHLRKQMVPYDLIRFWIGHAEKEITDIYSKVRDDISFRQEWAEKAGTGFELPTLHPNAVLCTQISQTEKAA